MLIPVTIRLRNKAFIIGGSTIYTQTMDRVNGIYLTEIDSSYEGDAYYPEIPDHYDRELVKRLQDNPVVEVFFYANTLNP